MLDIASIAKGFLEEKLKSGELKILQPEKEPRMFDLQDNFLEKKVCPTCARPLKLSRKGDGFCNRVSTKCKVWISAQKLDKTS